MALYNLEQGTSTIYIVCHLEAWGSSSRGSDSKLPEIYQMLLQGEYLQFCSLFPTPSPVKYAGFPIFDDQGVLGDLYNQSAGSVP